MNDFVQNDTFSWFSLIDKQNSYIFGIYASKKMTDHILEIAEFGLFLDNYFLKFLGILRAK